MINGEARFTFERVARMTLSVAVLSAIVVLAQYLSDVLIPFAAAVVLAYLLNPLVTLFEHRTRRRGLAVAITLGGLGVLGLAVVAVVVPLMVHQVQRVREDLTKLQRDLTSTTAVAPVTAPNEAAAPSSSKSTIGWTELKEGWRQYRRDAGQRPRGQRLADFRASLSGTYVGNLLEEGIVYSQSDEFRAVLLDFAKKIALGGWSVVTFGINVILGATGLIIVLLYLVFLLLDYPEYARTWPTFLPPQYRQPTVEFISQFDDALRRYFRGQALVSLLTATMVTIGFTVIGLPMAVPFGLFVGLLSMVPYLPAVSLIPGMMLAGLRAIEGDASFLGSVGLTLLVFAVVQVIQDSLVTPRIMGQATGLRPIAILLGVFIWGKLLGFLGLILSIPLTCLAIAYYRRYILLHAPGAVGGPPTAPPRNGSSANE